MALTPELSATLEDAEAYFGARLRADAWQSATADDKRRALAQAAMALDAACEFSEDAWRVKENGDVVWRPRIVAAICEQALWTLEYHDGATETLAALGVTRASVGGISATFDRARAEAFVCEAARSLVGRLGTFDSLDGGITSTPLAL